MPAALLAGAVALVALVALWAVGTALDEVVGAWFALVSLTVLVWAFHLGWRQGRTGRFVFLVLQFAAPVLLGVAMGLREVQNSRVPWTAVAGTAVGLAGVLAVTLFTRKSLFRRLPRTFISYRRAESSYAVDRVYEHLAREYTPQNVFRDIDTIHVGEDFAHSIERAISACDVVLVVMGPGWAHHVDASGAPRLHDPGDFVRMEVVRGLGGDCTVVPVLIDGARLPAAADLPPDLRPLLTLQTAQLRPVDSARDLHALTARVERARRAVVAERSPLRSPRVRRWRDVAFAAVAIMFATQVTALVLVGRQWEDTDHHPSPDGRHVLATTFGGAMALWDVGRGEITATARGSSNPIDLAWSPRGDRFAVGWWQDGLEVWSVDGLRRTASLEGGPGEVLGRLTWSGDGEWLAAVDSYGTLHLWEVGTGRHHSVEGAVEARVALSPRVALSTTGDRLLLYDGPLGVTVYEFAGDGLIRTPGAAADGPLSDLARVDAAVWTDDAGVLYAEDGVLRQRRFDGAPATTFAPSEGAQEGRFHFLSLSPGGKVVAAVESTSNGDRVWTWSTETGERLGRHTVAAAADWAYGDDDPEIAWEPGGRRLAVRAGNSTVTVVDPRPSEPAVRLTAPGEARLLSWGPDGVEVMSTSRDEVGVLVLTAPLGVAWAGEDLLHTPVWRHVVIALT